MSIYLEIAGRIRSEIPMLDTVMKKAATAWLLAAKHSEQIDIYLDSVALNLHSFYSGLERIFELIARHVDNKIQQGQAWHRDLIAQMASDIEEVRPAVISEENIKAIDEFRRFRHLVRNVYTTSLAPEKMIHLMEMLPTQWNLLVSELMAFSDFLEEADKSESHRDDT